MIKWVALNLVLGMAAWCSAFVDASWVTNTMEFVTDSTAQIAWSTNENSGTVVHYGTDSNNLNEKASMP